MAAFTPFRPLSTSRHYALSSKLNPMPSRTPNLGWSLNDGFVEF